MVRCLAIVCAVALGAVTGCKLDCSDCASSRPMCILAVRQTASAYRYMVDFDDGTTRIVHIYDGDVVPAVGRSGTIGEYGLWCDGEAQR